MPAISFPLLGAWSISQRFERLYHRSETTSRQVSSSCSPTFPRSSYSQDGQPANLCCVTASRRCTIRPKVAYSTVADILLMHWLIIIFGFRFRSRAVFLFDRFGRERVSFHVLPTELSLTTVRAMFGRLSMGCLVILRVWTAWSWFSNVILRLYNISQVLWRQGGAVFRICHDDILLSVTKDAIGAINKLDVINRFDTLSVAASVSKLFSL